MIASTSSLKCSFVACVHIEYHLESICIFSHSEYLWNKSHNKNEVISLTSRLYSYTYNFLYILRHHRLLLKALEGNITAVLF